LAADCPAASGAAPLSFCAFRKLSMPVSLMALRFAIMLVILVAVTLIQAFQAFARVLRAFQTEAQLAFAKQIAAIRHGVQFYPRGMQPGQQVR